MNNMTILRTVLERGKAGLYLLIAVLVFAGAGESVLVAQQSTVFWGTSNSIGRVAANNPDQRDPTFITNAGNVRDIDVDGTNNVIYWLTSAGAIRAANVQGAAATNIRNVVTGLSTSVTHLAHDGNFVYYLNRATGRIGRVGTNGSGRNDNFIIIGNAVSNSASGLFVRNGTVYWTNAFQPAMNLFGRSIPIGPPMPRIRSSRGGSMISDVASPLGSGPARDLTGNSGGLFVATPLISRSTFNGALSRFSPSANVVAADQSFLFYSSGSNIGRISTTGGSNQPSFISGVSGVTALAVGSVPPPPAPVITSFSPTRAGANRDITIDGDNFSNVTAVRFGNVNAVRFQLVNPSRIVARVPNNAGGTITVVSAGTNVTRPGFTFVAPPTLTSFTPQSAAQGEVITLNGTNFLEPLRVSIGGVPAAAVERVSNTQLRVTVGPGANGSIGVFTDGGSASLAGFTHLGAPFEVIGFRSETTPISAERDFQLNNSILEVTLKNNGATTRNIKFIGRLKQGDAVITETIAEQTPSLPIEPGETHVFTAGDIFREGAMRTPGEDRLLFPQGSYDVCVSIVEASNPNQVILAEMCEEIVVPPRLSPESVAENITKILGFPVEVTGVSADFDNYYISGRITEIPGNNIFRVEEGLQPVFRDVPIPLSAVTLDSDGDIDVVPVGGSFRLEDRVLPMTYFGWVPAVAADNNGIEISRLNSSSRIGVMRSRVRIDIDKLVRRTANSQALDRFFLSVPNGSPLFASGGTGNDAPTLNILHADGRNITTTNLNPSLQWVDTDNIVNVENSAYGTVSEAEFVGPRNGAPDAIRLAAMGPTIATFQLGRTSNSLEQRPTEIQLRNEGGLVIKLEGTPRRTPAGTSFSEGTLTIDIDGSRTKRVLYDIRELTLDRGGDIVSASIFPRFDTVRMPGGQIRQVPDTIQFDGFQFIPDERRSAILEEDDAEDGQFDVRAPGTMRLVWRRTATATPLIDWRLDGNAIFQAEGVFDMEVAQGLIPETEIGFGPKKITVAIEQVVYRQSNRTLYVDGSVALEVPNIKIEVGNFVFGPGQFPIQSFGIELDIKERFKFIGKVSYAQRSEEWNFELGGGIKVKSGTQWTVVASGRYVNRNNWGIGFRVERDPGIEMGKLTITQVRGSVNNVVGRWTVGLGGTGEVENVPQVQKLVIDIDVSLSWGRGGGVEFTIVGALAAEISAGSRKTTLPIGQARITFNSANRTLNGNITVNVRASVLATLTGSANIFINFATGQFHIDVNANVNITNLASARGRFVLAIRHNVTLEEGKGQTTITRTIFGRTTTTRGWGPIQRTHQNWSGVYFMLSSRFVNFNWSINIGIASASAFARAEGGAWGRTNFSFSDFGGGLYLEVAAGGSFRVIGIGASGTANINASMNLGRDNRGLWGNGNLSGSIDVRVGGRCHSNCSPGCNSVRFNAGWIWACGCGRGCIGMNLRFSFGRGQRAALARR